MGGQTHTFKMPVYGLWTTPRRLRGVKTHNLPAMIVRQTEAVRDSLASRWFDNTRRESWDGQGPRWTRQPFNHAPDDIRVLRMLRAELQRRENTPPTPKHNHGKGVACPMPPLPHPRYGGR